jgi:hypothetical protein
MKKMKKSLRLERQTIRELNLATFTAPAGGRRRGGGGEGACDVGCSHTFLNSTPEVGCEPIL